MMKSFKILSFILALTLVFASMTTVAFADVTEGTIVADINELKDNYKYRVSNQTAEQSEVIVPGDYNGTADSLKFYTDGKYSYTTKAGNENAIQFFTDNSNHQSLGGLTWTDYDSLKIETDIYIGDIDDGLGFRFRRYANGGNREYEIESGTKADFFVGVGGKEYSRNTVTDGYSYEVNTLDVGWNTVVIEIGSTTTDVKITVNDATPSIKARMKVTGSDAQNIDGQGLPEGTYGFCGSLNRTVLLPKSKSTSKLDVRVANFSMKATKFEVTDLSVYYHGTGAEARTIGKAWAINTTGKQQQVVIIVADYDEYNNMLKAKQSVVKFDPSNTEKVEQSNTMVRYSGTTPIKYSKAFVWDNLSGDIKPLITSASTQKDE